MSDRPVSFERSCAFPDLDSPLHEKELAIRIIDGYLNPTPFSDMGREAMPKSERAKKAREVTNE